MTNDKVQITNKNQLPDDQVKRLATLLRFVFLRHHVEFEKTQGPMLCEADMEIISQCNFDGKYWVDVVSAELKKAGVPINTDWPEDFMESIS